MIGRTRPTPRRHTRAPGQTISSYYASHPRCGGGPRRGSERNRVASLLQFFDVDPGYLAHAVEVLEITIGFAVLGDRIRIFLRETQNNDDVFTQGSIDVHTPADTKQVLLGGGEVVGGPFGPAIDHLLDD